MRKNGKEVWHLSNREFYSEEGAVKAAKEREKRLDSEKLSDEEVLKAYKEQQHAERGFAS